MTEAAVEIRDAETSASQRGSPRVSVVMPFRDAAPFIDEAVTSILAQSYGGLELIAIDDGSSDDGPAIVERLARRDPRIRLVREGRRGFVASLNRGIELARGEYIARMDADDVSLPDRLAKQVAYLDAHPEVGALGGQIFAVVDGDVVVPPWWIDTPLEHEAIAKSLLSRNSMYHPTALLRRDVLLATGGYRGAFSVVQDYDLWLRLAERTRLANLPDRVLHYRFHENQATERNLELAFLCTWSARHAADERRAGRPDPVRADTRIDREQAMAWGLDPADVDAQLLWIRASHRARAQLLRGYRLRAVGSILGLLLRHPGPFVRRALLALRTRRRRRHLELASRSPSSTSPASA